MKARGTRGGILLTLEPGDDVAKVEESLTAHSDLIKEKVALEVTDRTPYEVVEAVARRVREAGGTFTDVRPPSGKLQARGETVIISRTVRSGGRIESNGSVVVLGDVNAGAEVLANDDIIVIGALRGLAHAGAGGNEKAVIWAERILSPQLRIGGAVAQAAGHDEANGRGPEVALLKDGAILIRPWSSSDRGA
ncbi:MAG TPA: septum site-determining protein MinC [Trueperaceae bacterium]|nr:septum site-determining protein MinC [Trueperaceae bacterium]